MTDSSQDFYTPRGNPDGSYETLLVEKDGPIDWLTLNRPEALNAMSRTMMLELQHYFGNLYTNHEVRVVRLPDRVPREVDVDVKAPRRPLELLVFVVWLHLRR